MQLVDSHLISVTKLVDHVITNVFLKLTGWNDVGFVFQCFFDNFDTEDFLYFFENFVILEIYYQTKNFFKMTKLSLLNYTVEYFLSGFKISNRFFSSLLLNCDEEILVLQF